MALAVKIIYGPGVTFGVVADDTSRVARLLAPAFALGLIEPAVGGRRWGEVPSDELVPNDFGADERRFGAVPSDETVAEDFGADERRFGAVPTDESVPNDLT